MGRAGEVEVVHPRHYNRGGIEVWDVIDAYELGFHEGACCRYLLRAKFKGMELVDLTKAEQELGRAIRNLRERGNGDTVNPLPGESESYDERRMVELVHREIESRKKVAEGKLGTLTPQELRRRAQELIELARKKEAALKKTLDAVESIGEEDEKRKITDEGRKYLASDEFQARKNSSEYDVEVVLYGEGKGDGESDTVGSDGGDSDGPNDTSERVNAVGRVHDRFSGMSFYSGKREETEDGYRQERIDPRELPWAWYKNRRLPQCVRALRMDEHGTRILGIELGSRAGAALDFAGDGWLVCDEEKIFRLDNDVFHERYEDITPLVIRSHDDYEVPKPGSPHPLSL